MDITNINMPKELISDTVSFDARTPVTKMVSAIGRYGAVVVTKGSRYYGIVDNRSLQRFAVGSGVSKDNVGKYAVSVPAADSSMSIDGILLNFQKSRAKALPFVSNGKVRGVIKRFTLLKVLLSLKMLSDISAGEVMTSPVLAIDADATLSQARSAMRTNRVSRLVVLSGGKLYGIITDHDLLLSYSRKGERLPEMKSESHNQSDAQLRSVAARDLVVVDYADTLADAARDMIERNVSSVIVLRKGSPAGIITALDIFGSVLSKRNVKEEKVFVNGIEGDMREYEEDIMAALDAFMRKAGSMGKAGAPSLELNIKRIGSRMYEMRARLYMAKGGTIYVHALDYNIERTLNKLLDKLMKEIKKSKGKILSIRKISSFKKGMDEAENYVEL